MCVCLVELFCDSKYQICTQFPQFEPQCDGGGDGEDDEQSVLLSETDVNPLTEVISEEAFTPDIHEVEIADAIVSN